MVYIPQFESKFNKDYRCSRHRVYYRQSITITITGQFQSISIAITRPSITSIILYYIYCVLYISIAKLDKQQLFVEYIMLFPGNVMKL